MTGNISKNPPTPSDDGVSLAGFAEEIYSTLGLLGLEDSVSRKNAAETSRIICMKLIAFCGRDITLQKVCSA